MRAPTAFFLFSEEQREQTKAECIAAAEPGAKISVAIVAKAIGGKWQALTDAQKAAYQEKQLQRAAELAASAKADAETRAGLPSSSDMLPGFLWHAVLPQWCTFYLRKCVLHCQMREHGILIRVCASEQAILCKARKPRVTPRLSAEQKAEQDA